ncbi:MAG: NAD(P)H-dependent glycerol-3-phosphate dehydrogenase [Clostridiales bacterium]|nr:NAD(P)H-dependent glycerol-3-phosphate dehydrogenase [Clostridiales bacterium]
MSVIAVIGAGSWGTGLGVSLGAKEHDLRLWGIHEDELRDMGERRENIRYLPGVPLPPSLRLSLSREEALEGAEIVVFAAPSQQFRSALTEALPYLRPSMTIVNAAKGIEQGTLMRQSEIAAETLPWESGGCYVVLSGPSHAEEVGRALPTTLVAAAADRALAETVQEAFMSDRLRVYTSTDVSGVELGGALKNIIALGAGISDGLGFGDNTKAAMMTRGLAEMSRLGVALGAREDTFYGLAGIGDLIVTCTSMHSRNRRCGMLIGEGMKPAQAMERIGMTVEGVYTTEAAYALAQKNGVSMPITEHTYAVLRGGMSPRDAVESLMSRSKKHERAEEIVYRA